MTATRKISLTDAGLSDRLSLSADRPRSLTLQLRPAVPLTVRLAESTSTQWSGAEGLIGTHSCTAPAEFTTRPGPGTADDPQKTVSYVDWTAHAASEAEFRSDYEMRT